MNNRSIIFLIFAMLLVLTSCSNKIITDTYSHPLIKGSTASTEKVNDQVWLNFTVPHDDSVVQWQAIFDGNPPAGFQTISNNSFTQFKWIVSKDRVNFFGKDGYKFKISRLNDSYGVIITLRPEYSASLKFFGSMIH